jgi:hypothetical protein
MTPDEQAVMSRNLAAMSNRYQREVEKRALAIASEASSVEDFHVPHGHGEDTCVECDAQRLLLTMARVLSLHQIRRTLGGHGGRLDPLAPPLVARWHVLFQSRTAATDAIDAMRVEQSWLGMPVPGDPASITLTRTIYDQQLAGTREEATAHGPMSMVESLSLSN